MPIARYIALLFVLLVVASCGFHLRGEVTLANEFSPLFLDAKTSAPVLLRELKALLKTSRVEFAATNDEAASIIIIKAVKKSRRVLSVDSLGRAREYELNYEVHYLVSGKAIESTEKALKLTRELLFDPDTVLAAGYEEQTLYDDMAQDSARLILMQLQAIKVTGPGS